jgi:hypothetical protein
MAKRLLSFDPMTKTKIWHDYDHASGKTIICESQDVEDYLKANRAQQSSRVNDSNKGDYKKIATIPNSVIMKFKLEHNLDINDRDDLKKIEKLLMTNEYQYLRTCNRI